MPKSVILVTGASSGFGLMTSHALAQAGQPGHRREVRRARVGRQVRQPCGGGVVAQRVLLISTKAGVRKPLNVRVPNKGNHDVRWSVVHVLDHLFYYDRHESDLRT